MFSSSRDKSLAGMNPANQSLIEAFDQQINEARRASRGSRKLFISNLTQLRWTNAFNGLKASLKQSTYIGKKIFERERHIHHIGKRSTK